ncbi:MAG TPA: P1 family peptidase [Actinomycetota bacterium]|nr:P1 family peptidase [Actinomycetota bacterium]
MTDPGDGDSGPDQSAGSDPRDEPGGSIADVPGILVGNWTDPQGLTGCTVVLCPPGTVGSGEVRGGAPGTRETDLLRPGMLVDEVHAVLLTGGSAFGLAAADGLVRFLEERGIGFDTGVARVPIVPGAVLFDLWVGDAGARPGPDAGYAAAADASADVTQGNVGAGTGATVAKQHGPERAVKGGLGTASARRGDLVVGVVVAVNAVGEILDDAGEILAGALPDPAGDAAATTPAGSPNGHAVDGWSNDPDTPGLPFTNTTIGVVATNARLSKERAHLLALAAHDGLDIAIRPAHTMHDGDTVFSLATGETDASQSEIEEMAVEVMARAIRSAVLHAVSVAGIPAARAPGGPPA